MIETLLLWHIEIVICLLTFFCALLYWKLSKMTDKVDNIDKRNVSIMICDESRLEVRFNELEKLIKERT